MSPNPEASDILPFLRGFGVAALAAAALAGATAHAEDANPVSPWMPGTVIQGSGDVSVGGAPAARAGDATTTGAPVVEGSPDVMINGKPAAVLGSRTGCGGVVVGGGGGVFVNGKPLARAGDATAPCTTR